MHIIVDITLPVYIRVYGQHYLQEGQGCEDPDPPVVFPGLGAGYPVADHGNADPLGEEGQQVGGHKGVGFQEHTHKKDGRETGQRPVRHCFKHILEKWHGHIDGEGHVDQPQKGQSSWMEPDRMRWKASLSVSAHTGFSRPFCHI